ncbi:ATP synthase F0 subunit C [Thalassoglobus sp. JC818]|uniref:ATP synthase F0 subunit C n=1 Tax=Thalassoglobus sp. JC818 TaxID=3232136 RepID=UPI00345AD493
MSRVFQVVWCAAIAVLFFAAPAVAQEATVKQPLIDLTPAFGAGLVMIAAGFGIAKIGAAAVESMARQPEAAKDISGGMLLAAALIEGATFFALIVCILGIVFAG